MYLYMSIIIITIDHYMCIYILNYICIIICLLLVAIIMEATPLVFAKGVSLNTPTATPPMARHWRTRNPLVIHWWW